MVEAIIVCTPVQDWQTESLVIADWYKKNIAAISFYKKDMKVSFTQTEAYAFNSMLGATSSIYNVFFRKEIEPKLLPCKPLENLK